MRVIIDNKIYVEDPSPELSNWCKENLIIDNPDFFKKEKLGKWTGNTPKQIWLYEKNGNDLLLPFGCIKRISPLLHNVKFKSLIKPLERISYESGINLYSYQKKAVESVLKAKNGILVMPPGSGKTQTGLEIISRLGGKALWLTHTKDLLTQSMNRAKGVLDIDGTYGTITEGKADIGSHITFATIQTLSKMDLSHYKDMWDVIIVDEVHHAAGSPTRVTQFYKVLSRLSARYKIGLTATPKRADGLEKSMFALLGDIVHEVTRDEISDFLCPIKVTTIETGYRPDYDIVLLGDGTLDYTKLVDAMIHDEQRFELVKEIIEDCISKGSTLVLGNRIEYLQRMNDAVDGNTLCLSGMGYSKKAKEERKNALKKLNDGELDCVLSSYLLAKEGLDVPNLRYVIFATPEKDPTTIQQSVGRVGRKADGKDCGTVIDLVDSFGMYKGWRAKRESVYKKIHAEY